MQLPRIRQIKTQNKMVFITAWLVNDPEAYKDKTDAEIEKEIMDEIGPIPYVARLEKATVLNCPENVQPEK
jgi:hypothetical protein